MKTVYIHGSNSGIRWVEETASSSMSTDSSQWSSGVKFEQHPDSEQDVFVDETGGDVAFSLSRSASPLKAKAIEMRPATEESVFFKADSGGSSAQQGQRWYSGYVQKK